MKRAHYSSSNSLTNFQVMLLNPLNYKIKELNHISPNRGRLLIAEPFMDDPFFKRSVVLLTDYNMHDGAFGFILNKPLGFTINDTLKDFPEFNSEVFMGGPVESDQLFFIHSQGLNIMGSKRINSNLYWSTNFDRLKELIIEQEIFPNEVMFFVGYSGWDIDQLNDEIEGESWIIADRTYYTQIEDLKVKDCWGSYLRKMGPQHSIISHFPEDPSFN